MEVFEKITYTDALSNVFTGIQNVMSDEYEQWRDAKRSSSPPRPFHTSHTLCSALNSMRSESRVSSANRRSSGAPLRPLRFEAVLLVIKSSIVWQSDVR